MGIPFRVAISPLGQLTSLHPRKLIVKMEGKNEWGFRNRTGAAARYSKSAATRSEYRQKH